MTLLLWGLSVAISELMARKPDIEDAKPSGLGDFKFPTATEGRPLPLVWGTVPIEGPNVVWSGDLRVEAITEKIKYSMFRSKRVVRGHRYKVGMQFALCQGPDVEFVRFDIGKKPMYSELSVWNVALHLGGTGYTVGDVLTLSGGTPVTPAAVKVTKTFLGVVLEVELIEIGRYTVLPGATVSTTTTGGGTGCQLTTSSGIVAHGGTVTFDRPTADGGDELGNGGFSGDLQFFSGTDSQSVSSYLSQFQKIPAVTGDTPAYRDVCYLAPATGPIDVGNSTNIRPWRFIVRRTPNPISLTGDRHIVNDGDANPACALYEFVKNAEWGFGVDAADIDTAAFVAAGNTLHAEGNGFSFLLDRQEDIGEMLRRVEAQIDGMVYEDRVTGKWTIRLVRDDYVIGDLPSIEVGVNVIEVLAFHQATWEGTKNQVRTPFVDVADNYKESFGFAQDLANILIVGRITNTAVTHPGVKDAALANSLAWRELRTLAFPLATCEITVDRTLYGVLAGDVVRLTAEPLGLVDLPMRVRSANYGDLLDGKITLALVQDVFRAAAGTFADPPRTEWEPPTADLDSFPVDEQLAFEAPRALVRLDPDSSSPTADKVFAAARKQGGEAFFRILERHAAGTPTGAYTAIGEVYGFLLAGELLSGLSVGSVYPLASVTITPTPDTQEDILAEFTALAGDVEEIGRSLSTLILVDDEFMLVESAAATGANVRLDNVYRGALDSVQGEHSAGAPVYLLFVGAGMSDTELPAGDNVDVVLLPISALGTVEAADATAISFTMANRTRRPYAPAEFDLNGTRFDTTNVDLDASGSGEDVGVLFDSILRRDFRTDDEVASLLTDAGTLYLDFPAANATTVELLARNGVTDLYIEEGISGTSGTLRQLDILQGLDTTTLPASLTFGVRQSHTFEGATYKSLEWLTVTATIVSDMIGKHAFGALDQADVSTVYVVQVGDGATDHIFSLSSAFTVGDVEYRINGGAWTTLIAAGGTSGTIPNASIIDGDDIEVRHGSTDVAPQKLLRMTVSGTVEAYAVLFS